MLAMAIWQGECAEYVSIHHIHGKPTEKSSKQHQQCGPAPTPTPMLSLWKCTKPQPTNKVDLMQLVCEAVQIDCPYLP